LQVVCDLMIYISRKQGKKWASLLKDRRFLLFLEGISKTLHYFILLQLQYSLRTL
jgi:hypothetical protein